MTNKETKLRGLFVNPLKANCSIYESGVMCYNCLKLGSQYTIDYIEVSEESRSIPLLYDFYVFNYHVKTMGWLNTKAVRSLPGFKTTIVLEVSPNNPFVMCPKGDFDAYLVLDPTVRIGDSNVYPFPRPLEKVEVQNKYVEKEVPVIGTFGFATSGKGFDNVIDAVNKEFDKAIIKINIPKGDYVPKEVSEKLFTELKNHPSKDEVNVIITDHFFNKEELIEWCAQNTINVFLYNRNMPGLSATTDQAISSGRPLAISTNATFRHIHHYLKPYPFQSLKESILNAGSVVENIQKEWAPINFALKFEQILEARNIESIEKTNKRIQLPSIYDNRYLSFIKRLKTSDFTPPIVNVFKNKIKTKLNKQVDGDGNIVALEPFVHSALLSYSQNQEDLLLDLLFNKKDTGLYVDIGPNDPDYNNNTKRFYLRGWKGINVEPGTDAFRKIREARPGDVNVNMAVSEKKGKSPFYRLSNDTTLSTLDYSTAKEISGSLNLPISTTTIETVPLATLLCQNLNDTPVDFMSVNAKGHDLTVLKSNDWNKFRPSVVMVESRIQYKEIWAFMEKNNYLHIYSNLHKAIFIDKSEKNEKVLSNLNWEHI